VKAPQANPHEFYVFAQNSEHKKVSQAFTQCPYSSEIQQTLREAQYSFLNSSLEKAQEKFSEISEKKWNCDWSELDRKAIVFTLFRLAQLTQLPSMQMNYLAEAINFDDSILPDKQVFPPPLVKLYHDTKKKMEVKEVLLPNFAQKYTALLKNGKFHSLANLSFKTYSLRSRITFVSDSYKAETMIILPEELQKTSLTPVPLVDGDCKNMKASSELSSLDDYKVFFSADCVVSSNNPILQAQGLPGIPTLETSVPRKKTWVERNWVWLGIAVAGAAIAIHQANQDDEPQTVRVPSTTFQTP